MTGAVAILIKLGVRLVVFGLVFWLAARRSPNVVLPNKWATPLIAFTFAVLNTGLYWVLKPIMNVATLGALGFAMPFVVNLILLGVTVRIFQSKKWIEINGMMTTIWMALVLTLAHGAMWLAIDYIPKHV